ncbi:methyl-CpG-binding domain protein 1-like isoform 2-T2 [Mantella aurantiaca]
MSEGWEDWPLLGKGWKRRTAVRKSGQSCGHSDTYYQSPTGQRFRSKPELSKFLGDSVDLSCFNFKHGTLIPLEKRKKSKKKKKKTTPSSPVASTSSVTPTSPGQSEKYLSFPIQSPDEHQQNGKEAKSACCISCKVWYTGVEFGRSKPNAWYCANCRASRRAYNREQKLLKTIGCGKCDACSLTENCGCCSICLLRIHNPEFRSSWKCVKRRCLKAIYKPGSCGECSACTATEDCETCSVCLKKQQYPELGINTKCMRRRCHKKKSGRKSSTMKGFAPKKLKTKWRLMSERDGSSVPVKHKKVGRRRNRKCGTCEACQRKVDCGDCDFCQDKPKFGGRNLKRQKCRWRQCLRFATEKNIPVNLKSSNHPVILERLHRERLAADDEKMEALQREQGIKLTPRLPIIKLERLDYRNGGFTSTADGGGWIINKVETKPIKEEVKESNLITQEIQEEPLDLHCPVKPEEFIVETDDVEAADESTPVITQIFSLGSLNSKNMVPVLQELLTELNEIPLPAHWEVLCDIGPTLQLVQRSKASTMADTVVHIQPELHFHIVVREYTVPSFHELYQTHPSRLTTVDDVLELICDLEAYRPCAGLPRHGPRSPSCQVLVYEEWCPECSQNPWPSGYFR